MTSASPLPSTTVVYFITGASRGIGYGLTERLAARPNTLVYAGARDPSTADKLQQLAKQHNNVRVVKLSVTSDEDHVSAAKQVEAEAGRVDVLLANAGISNADAYERVEKLTIDKLRENFEVNAVGPIRLFDAFFTLLSRLSDPKFIVVSSFAGSIGYQSNLPTFYVSNYGASKAAANFIVQRIHVEHTNMTAFPIHPGWVQTEMGNAGAAIAGMKEAPMTLEQSVSGILGIVDKSTRATHSGKFWNVEDGGVVAW